MSTRNRLDLQTLESHPIMPKNMLHRIYIDLETLGSRPLRERERETLFEQLPKESIGSRGKGGGGGSRQQRPQKGLQPLKGQVQV